MSSDYVYFDNGLREVMIRKDSIAWVEHRAETNGRGASAAIHLVSGAEIDFDPSAFGELLKRLGPADKVDSVTKSDPSTVSRPQIF